MRLSISLIIIILIILSGGAAYYLAAPPSQFFSPQEKVFTIGVIINPPSLNPAWEGFQRGMEARGYKEGRNVKYIVEAGGKDIASAKQVVANMIESGAEAFYVMGSLGGKAAKEVTAERRIEIPVVFGVISNPIGGKLVESMQSSGNNLTGITPINEIIGSKRLEIFLEMVPGTKRIIFPWSDPNTNGLENIRNAAKLFNVELVEKQATDTTAMKSFVTSFPFRPGDVIFRAADGTSGAIIKDIIAVSLEKKIPLSGTNSNDVTLGGLMSYGANFEKIGEQAARLMDSVLKGAKPSDLPIELPEEFEFVINAKTAEALSLTIPSASLNKANRVIR